LTGLLTTSSSTSSIGTGFSNNRADNSTVSMSLTGGWSNLLSSALSSSATIAPSGNGSNGGASGGVSSHNGGNGLTSAISSSKVGTSDPISLQRKHAVISYYHRHVRVATTEKVKMYLPDVVMFTGARKELLESLVTTSNDEKEIINDKSGKDNVTNNNVSKERTVVEKSNDGTPTGTSNPTISLQAQQSQHQRWNGNDDPTTSASPPHFWYGSLLITNYQVSFIPDNVAPSHTLDVTSPLPSSNLMTLSPLPSSSSSPHLSSGNANQRPSPVSVPLLSIRREEAIPFDARDLGLLELTSKDFRTLRFLFVGLVKRQRYYRYL
jgi:hypothetical protein